MYGFEAQTSGGTGGLAAVTPYQDLYFPSAAGIRSPTAGVIRAHGVLGTGEAPVRGIGDQLGSGSMAGKGMNYSGTAATTPISQLQNHWSSVLDFHNSPAPWILIGILVLYGWLHATARVKAGRASASVVL